MRGEALAAGNSFATSDYNVGGEALSAGNSFVTNDHNVSGEALAAGNSFVTNDHNVRGEALAAGNSFATNDHNVSGEALSAGNSFATNDYNVSGVALAAGNSEPTDPITRFITCTTYGTWLPGDSCGWRKWKSGEQQPQPLLGDWCRDQMKEKPVLLNATRKGMGRGRGYRIHRHG